MKPTTQKILTVLRIFSWVLFFSFCIKAGALLISFIVSLLSNHAASVNLYSGFDLTELLKFSKWHYVVMNIAIIILIALKANLFFRVTRLFSSINLENPFSDRVATLITSISHIALQVGVVGVIIGIYAKWLLKKGPLFSYEGDNSEYLFLAAIVFIIAQIFKRGIELQTENDLTV
ncbi:DUF2975 domain-containing protein [Robertkochia solimangrovi]|uniref:DUF2975 domain-containing protein n=1 Tax=Robertkochia solimangrovi TaxID=2213046 RepID=UPI0013A557CA|nr:DUF2975 domain-containing protein [Robertkochia solimangrovi]